VVKSFSASYIPLLAGGGAVQGVPKIMKLN
jgi:hypothetical protein